MTTPEAIPPPPPPPPPPPTAGIPPPPPVGGNLGVTAGFPNQRTTRLRRFNWEKIPDFQVNNAENIWAESQNQMKVDFQAMDDLFSVNDRPLKRSAHRGSLIPTVAADSDSSNTDDVKGKITLLDGKRNLNVNIFLRQFKRTISVMAESIRACDVSFMNSDKLRSLRKLLPTKEEIQILKEYKGSPSQLDTAEHFLFKVIQIPYYVIRIDVILLREEFDHAMSQIDQSLLVLQNAMKEIKNCYALPCILHLVLQAGNYLNRGASFGNAVGFRLASLKSLADTKANKPGMTLMHYVAMELKKNDAEMMQWTNEIPSVELASRVSEEELREEIKLFRQRVENLSTKVFDEADDELRENVGEFLKKAETRLSEIFEQEKTITQDSKQLAAYLCENPDKFTLSNCCQIVSEFRKKFIKAADDNLKREIAAKKRENSAKLGDLNNNKRHSTLKSKRHTALVEGSTTLIGDGDGALISYRSKTGSFRRSNTISTPHRRYGMAQRTSTPENVSDTVKRTKLQSDDYLRRKSRSKPSPDEIKRLYEQQYKIKTIEIDTPTPKHAWDEKSDNQTTNKPTKPKNDLDERLGAYGSVSASKVSRENHFSNDESVQDKLGNAMQDSNQKEKQTTEATQSLSETDYPESKEEPAPLVQLHQPRSSFERRARPSSMIITNNHRMDLDEDLSADDLEHYVDSFAKQQRERMFERTQLRRSYIRLPRDEESRKPAVDSTLTSSSIVEENAPVHSADSDLERPKYSSSRSSSVSSHSTSAFSTSHTDDTADVYSTDASRALEDDNNASSESRRHSDIRERIKRYKESNSSADDVPAHEKRKTSAGSCRKDSSQQLPADGLERRVSAPATSSNADSRLSTNENKKEEPKRLRRGLNSLTHLAAMYEQYEKEDNNDLKFDTKVESRDGIFSEPEEPNCATSAAAPDDPLKGLDEQSENINRDENTGSISKDEGKENQADQSENEVEQEVEDKLSEMDPSVRSPTPEPRRRKSSLYRAPTLVVVPPGKNDSTAARHRNEHEPERRKSFLISYTSKPPQDVSNAPEQSSSMRDLRKTASKRTGISTPKTAVKNLLNKITQPKKKQEKLQTPSNATRRVSDSKLPLRAKLSVSSAGDSTDVEMNDTASLLVQDADTKTRGKKMVSPSPSTSTSRSVSPVPPKSSQKGSSSPCRPASRSSGLVSPSTTMKPKNSDSKMGKTQSNTSKTKTKKSTGQQASVVAGKETKQKPHPKKVVTSKSPNIRKTGSTEKQISPKPVPVQKQLKKTSSNTSGQTKKEKSVETKVTKNSEANKNQNNNNNTTALDMKETNLSDDKTKTDIVQKQQSENNSTISPSHSAVQMNRAARLRLLKKAQSPSTKGNI